MAALFIRGVASAIRIDSPLPLARRGAEWKSGIGNHCSGVTVFVYAKYVLGRVDQPVVWRACKLVASRCIASIGGKTKDANWVHFQLARPGRVFSGRLFYFVVLVLPFLLLQPDHPRPRLS